MSKYIALIICSRNSNKTHFSLDGAPGVLGIWGEWLFIFRELGSTGNYLRGAREHAHSLRDLGSLAKMKKIEKKASILFDYFLSFICFIPKPP